MENIEQTSYKIEFEIKGKPLWISFGSYNDYTPIPKKELEDFIIYLIKKCVKAKLFMNDDENVLFVKNINFYKDDNKEVVYCFEKNRSVQIYPM